MKKWMGFCVIVSTLLFGSGCSTVLTHTPSEKLKFARGTKPIKLAVANIGDMRPEAPNAIGFGISFWLPQAFWAKDAAGNKLPVAHFVANSLKQDLTHVGYRSMLVNKNYQPLSAKQAMSAAKKSGTDYLITSKVTHGKSNFWGYLLIPFVEPVKTRIGLEICIIDLNALVPNKKFKVYREGRDWNFAKITIFDAVFDAAFFGRYWHRKAWGETVVPDALADVTLKIISETKPTWGEKKASPKLVVIKM